MHGSFSETDIIMNEDPLTLQLKHKHYISALITILPQKFKYPYNDDLSIRHFDPVKQYYTLESPAYPGRPIIALIESVQCADDFVIAARYHEYDEKKHHETQLHEYQNMELQN